MATGPRTRGPSTDIAGKFLTGHGFGEDRATGGRRVVRWRTPGRVCGRRVGILPEADRDPCPVPNCKSWKTAVTVTTCDLVSRRTVAYKSVSLRPAFQRAKLSPSCDPLANRLNPAGSCERPGGALASLPTLSPGRVTVTGCPTLTASHSPPARVPQPPEEQAPVATYQSLVPSLWSPVTPCRVWSASSWLTARG